jgi:transcriptional regulator with XRE-family HTH domain
MVYKAVKKLCDKKGVSVYKLEQELGFAASTILKWKKSIPTAESSCRLFQSSNGTVTGKYRG